MRILYVARHDAGGNDDEGAVTHALRQLGHEVSCAQEGDGISGGRFDLLLFNKWSDFERIRLIDAAVKAFWYWDRVDDPDPTLAKRCKTRKEWMRRATDVADLGFCTDGDWVEQDAAGKLHWLPQGADEGVLGYGAARCSFADILFAGSVHKCGARRMSFVAMMQERYGERFRWVQGCYRRDLADEIASAKLVVAPDAPVSDRYWSNRAYMQLGFGACLLHPYAAGLERHYRDGVGLLFYRDREHLHELIAESVNDPERRRQVAARGLALTREQHTYRERCAELIRIVKGRLHV